MLATRLEPPFIVSLAAKEHDVATLLQPYDLLRLSPVLVQPGVSRHASKRESPPQSHHRSLLFRPESLHQTAVVWLCVEALAYCSENHSLLRQQ
jgi:hypothetical protein